MKFSDLAKGDAANEAPKVPAFVPALVFTDPTPSQIIINRITRRAGEIAHKYTDLSTAEGSDFMDVVLLLSIKLAGVYKFYEGYCREEDRLIEFYKNTSATHVDFGQTLFEQYDGFAVQLKSTLDFLVKVLRPTLGLNIHTFGKKGVSVFKVLERNTPKEHEFKARMIEKICFSDARKEWLTAIISSRDKLNHYQGEIKLNTFAVYKRKDDTIDVPKWNNEQTLRDAMKGFWYELFFCRGLHRLFALFSHAR